MGCETLCFQPYRWYKPEGALRMADVRGLHGREHACADGASPRSRQAAQDSVEPFQKKGDYRVGRCAPHYYSAETLHVCLPYGGVWHEPFVGWLC